MAAKLVKVWSSFSKLAGDGTPQEAEPLGDKRIYLYKPTKATAKRIAGQRRITYDLISTVQLQIF